MAEASTAEPEQAFTSPHILYSSPGIVQGSGKHLQQLQALLCGTGSSAAEDGDEVAESSGVLPGQQLHMKRDRALVLFGGTRILQHTPDKHARIKTPDGGCLAYVLRTGFETAQGAALAPKSVAIWIVLIDSVLAHMLHTGFGTAQDAVLACKPAPISMLLSRFALHQTCCAPAWGLPKVLLFALSSLYD